MRSFPERLCGGFFLCGKVMGGFCYFVDWSCGDFVFMRKGYAEDSF